MAVLYWKLCYNEARYNEVGLYQQSTRFTGPPLVVIGIKI